MVVCPKCKYEIGGLNHQKEGLGYGFVYLDGGELEFEVGEFNDEGASESYSCPHCDEVVATTEEEAIKLLTPTSEKGLKIYITHFLPKGVTGREFEISLFDMGGLTKYIFLRWIADHTRTPLVKGLVVTYYHNDMTHMGLLQKITL